MAALLISAAPGSTAVAPTGVLAWISSPVVGMDEGALVEIDRHGKIAPLPTPVRSYTPRVRLSPDRRRLAVTINTLREVALWVYDLAGQTWTQVNGDGEALYPTWMPDGRRLVFLWQAGGRDFLATQPAERAWHTESAPRWPVRARVVAS